MEFTTKSNTIGLILLLFLGIACQFGDTNIDPVRPVTATLDEVLPIAIVQTYRNINSIGGRVTGIVMQHLEGVDAQPLSYEQYLIDERTLDNLWRTGFYVGAMRDCQWIIDKVAEDGADQRYAAIAKILLAHNLGLATSFWGDIPYSEAFVADEIIYPTYDEQEKIYDHILRHLEEAAQVLTQSRDTSTMAADLIFSGDAEAWQSTAHALLARFNLHLGARQDHFYNAALIHADRVNWEEDNAQAPQFHYLNNRNGGNPFALYLEERPGQIVLGGFLLDFLQRSSDPRLAAMAQETEGAFLIYDDLQQISFYWTRLDTPIPLISETELLFIKAEALLRNGMDQRAEEALIEAVAAHGKQMGIADEPFYDWIDQHIRLQDCPSFDCKLERLIEQKYVAMYVQGAHEAWNDYRRTGYPSLMVSENANASFNPSLVVPRRYLYPISERTANQNAYQSAIDRQGGHFMDVNTWIFSE